MYGMILFIIHTLYTYVYLHLKFTIKQITHM